jgi:hypothetical protein
MHAVTGANTLKGLPMVAAIATAAAAIVLAACEAPFGLALPSTRALESGAADTMDTATGFEVKGNYIDSGAPWTVDFQLARPQTEHLLVGQGNTNLEAIIIGGNAYFRGQTFLSQHLGTASAARTLEQAAGNAWWKASAANMPGLADFTDGTRLRATFMGSVVSQRTDHISVDGIDAADLSSPRADVYIAAPHQLLWLHMKQQAVIDGIAGGDLHFSNFNTDFKIAAPTNVIDFSNLSTLPPLYTVASVDTSGCGSPCKVSALIRNQGGMSGAKAPSTITFTVTATASNAVLGTCQVQVVPDVGYNGTATVSCTIANISGQQANAASVTAAPDNPGRA